MKSTEDKARLIAATVVEIPRIMDATGIAPYAPTARQYNLQKSAGAPTAKVALNCAGLPVTVAGWMAFTIQHVGIEVEPREVMQSRRHKLAARSRGRKSDRNTGEDVTFFDEREFVRRGLLVYRVIETEHETIYMLR